MKIVRFEQGMALIYWCTKETIRGTCNSDGVRADLIGRSRKTPLQSRIALLSFISFACLAPDSIKIQESTGKCFDFLAIFFILAYIIILSVI